MVATADLGQPSGSGAPALSAIAAGLATAIETVSTTTYTFVQADHNKIKLFTHASGCTATVPAGLTLPWVCAPVQAGAAQVTIAASGVTIHEPDSQLKTEKQWVQLLLRATAADVFLLSGRTAA